jgi:hypothetical protein
VRAKGEKALRIDAPSVQDSTEQGSRQLSPVISQRRWEQQAEDNVLDRLTSAGLLRTAAVPLTSAREKVPLAVTPLMPYIRYAEPAASSTSR